MANDSYDFSGQKHLEGGSRVTDSKLQSREHRTGSQKIRIQIQFCCFIAVGPWTNQLTPHAVVGSATHLMRSGDDAGESAGFKGF